MTLIGKRKILEELTQAKHLPDFFLFTFETAQLAVIAEFDHEPLHALFVLLHPLLQLLGLEYTVITRRITEYLVEVTQHAGVGQTTFAVQVKDADAVRADIDGTNTDEAQHGGREKALVVILAEAIGIEHLIGILQIAVGRQVAPPAKVLKHFSACTPPAELPP